MTPEQIKAAKRLQARDMNYELIAQRVGCGVEEVWEAIASERARHVRLVKETRKEI